MEKCQWPLPKEGQTLTICRSCVWCESTRRSDTARISDVSEQWFRFRQRDTPQRFPRAGSQSFPSPAAEASADGTTTIYFSPTQPAGVKRGNWIQTDPAKGWFTILRLYSPAEPFFTKAWRPSEVELVR